METTLLAPKDASVVEGKRWLVLLVFAWIEFNQVRLSVHPPNECPAVWP